MEGLLDQSVRMSIDDFELLVEEEAFRMEISRELVHKALYISVSTLHLGQG
jgi:hypothetical protein